jgi:hypothetical protein
MAEQNIDEMNDNLAVESLECLFTVRSIFRTDLEVIPSAAPNHRRTAGFTPAEDLALARAWTSVSQKWDEQNAPTFWNSVAVSYGLQPEARTLRTSESLRCRWSSLQRTVQKYLAREKIYNVSLPSGTTMEDAAAEVMRLYRTTNKTEAPDGQEKLAAEIKSVDAAAFLGACPKISTRMGGVAPRSAQPVSGVPARR